MSKKIFSIAILALIILGLVFVVKGGRLGTGHGWSTIAGVVVPHHNIVANQRTQFFTQLAAAIPAYRYPKTIILVSPNHYLAGQSKIQTTDHDWQLSEGSINANKEVISKLVSEKLVTNEPGSFKDEHGIYNILGDIHINFPKAQLVPLILEDASQVQLDKLEKTLNTYCHNCLMISSVDFSHYEPALLADLHDQKSIRDLQTLDTVDVLKNAEVDSGAALALLTMWARDHGTVHFNLKNHTDSDLLLSQPDTEGTSHVFGWYEGGKQVEPEKFVSFVVSSNTHVGDEDRAIWGTDVVIKEPIIDFVDPAKVIIAGKLTPQGLQFFGLPVVAATNPKDYSTLMGAPQKQQALVSVYELYKKYLVSSPAGDYIKIDGKTDLPFQNLSSSTIESKIKLLINLNK